MIQDIRPDWSGAWTLERAQRELTGWAFLGPGWYREEHDTLLVVPRDRPLAEYWEKAVRHPDEVFLFYVWNGRDPRNALRLVLSAPTRKEST